MKNLAGKTIFITGASSGIGRELARMFSMMGSKLILLDMDLDGLKKLNLKAELIKCDLSKKEEIDKIKADFLKKTDVLINNAGIGAKEFFLKEDYSEFERIVNVNFFGMTYLTKRFLNNIDFKKKRFIVNVCSIAGVVHVPFMGAYSSSKAAAYNFTNLLRIELHDKNIKVMAVIPGPTKTKFGQDFKNSIKHGNFYEKHVVLKPEKVARAIISGIQKEKKSIFIPWYLKITAIFCNVFPFFYDFLATVSLKRIKVK